MASHDQSFRAGEAKGQAQEKTNQTMDSMKGKAEAAKNKTYATAEAAKDKTKETADAARDKAYEGKEKTGGILQKTGEQMKNMAHNAADAVKNTFGMANEDDEERTATCRRDSVTYTK